MQSEIFEWSSRFFTFETVGPVLATSLGVGALVGVIVAILKHFGASKPDSGWHWWVLFYDVWKVSALSLTIGVTINVANYVSDTKREISTMIDQFGIFRELLNTEKEATNMLQYKLDIANQKNAYLEKRYTCIEAYGEGIPLVNSECSKAAEAMEAVLAPFELNRDDRLPTVFPKAVGALLNWQ